MTTPVIKLTPLDNAAKIYVCTNTAKFSAQYHIGAVLNEKVNTKILLKAVAALAPRFPLMYSQITKGEYWDYLKPATDFDIVYKDRGTPCSPFFVGQTDRPLFRVLYGENTVSIEVFHSLTDGTGGMTYLKSLLFQYYSLLGEEIQPCDGILTVDQKPSSEELQDAYQDIYREGVRTSRDEVDAFQYSVEKENNYLGITQLTFSVSKVKKLAKAHGGTVTQLLSAIYFRALVEQKRKQTKNPTRKKPVILCIPFDVRKIIKSKTMRNFALTTNLRIDENNLSIDEIITSIDEQLKKATDEQAVRTMICQNVYEEKQWIARVCPMKWKRLIMGTIVNFFGERRYTTQLSNLGYQRIPKEMEKHIISLDFYLGHASMNALLLGVVAVNDTITLSFSSKSRDQEIQKYFLSFLEDNNIEVAVKLPQ